MIFVTEEETGLVSSSAEAQDTSVARIATTSHMFSILSSRLYADKVSAVLREIGCNAQDAHTAAGKVDLPFEVKLPNQLDPTFYVKDWGPGLDESGVRNLYMTYGESTKQSSNLFIGAMGLGSKSPFAYAHTFTIVAVRDGVKRYFTAYLNEQKVPVITKTLECPAEADWPSGLMVTFPVEPRDQSEFAAKAALIYNWFTVPPRILGLPDSEKPAFPKFAFFKKSEQLQYGFEPQNPAYCRDEAAVVMGNIRYPFSVRKVIERFPELKELFGCYLHSSAHVFLSIGDVQFTPSRESLEYDKRTLETLKESLLNIAFDIGKDLLAELAVKDSTRVGRLKRLAELRDKYAATGFMVRGALLNLFTRLGVEHSEASRYSTLLTADSTLTAPPTVGPKGNCQVFYLARHESTRRAFKVTAPKHEVVAGKIQMGARDCAIAFSAEKNVPVFYLDGTAADVRHLRAAIIEGTYDAAFLVVAAGATTAERVALAKQHAEYIAGPEGFDGLPTYSTKTIIAPAAERAAELLGTRRQRLTEEDRLARMPARTWVLGDYHLGNTKVGAVLKNPDVRYYLVVDQLLSTRNALAGYPDSGNTCISGETLQQVAANKVFSALMEQAGFAPFKTVLVVTAATRDRAKLQDKGLLNMVDVIAQVRNAPEMPSRVVELLKASPVDDAVAYSRAIPEQCGYGSKLRSILEAAQKGEPLWNALKQRFASSVLARAVERVVEATAKPKSYWKSPESTPLFDAERLAVLLRWPSLQDALEKHQPEIVIELQQASQLAEKAFKPLNLDRIRELALKAESREQALAHLELALFLCGEAPIKASP